MKWLGVALVAAVLLDVFPRCGGPTVSVQEPGQDCGHHGPHWRGDCRIGECFRNSRTGNLCTKACSADSDCASLGPTFRCAGTGYPYSSVNSKGETSICTQPKPPTP